MARAQRMSVALHLAAAWEIAAELGLEGGEDEAAIFAWRGRRHRRLDSLGISRHLGLGTDYSTYLVTFA